MGAGGSIPISPAGGKIVEPSEEEIKEMVTRLQKRPSCEITQNCPIQMVLSGCSCTSVSAKKDHPLNPFYLFFFFTTGSFHFFLAVLGLQLLFEGGFTGAKGQEPKGGCVDSVVCFGARWSFPNELATPGGPPWWFPTKAGGGFRKTGGRSGDGQEMLDFLGRKGPIQGAVARDGFGAQGLMIFRNPLVLSEVVGIKLAPILGLNDPDQSDATSKAKNIPPETRRQATDKATECFGSWTAA